jgi:hypothetical protein
VPPNASVQTHPGKQMGELPSGGFFQLFQFAVASMPDERFGSSVETTIRY